MLGHAELVKAVVHGIPAAASRERRFELVGGAELHRAEVGIDSLLDLSRLTRLKPLWRAVNAGPAALGRSKLCAEALGRSLKVSGTRSCETASIFDLFEKC
jgi:AMMECR1 domain-containing protein